MKIGGKLVVQIGGSGKGCGKTSLIEKLLTRFPGSAYIKSALHFDADPLHGGDDKRCSHAGASYSITINQQIPEELNRAISDARQVASILFVERNKLDDLVKPDIYVFVYGGVSDLRPDSRTRMSQADLVYKPDTDASQAFADLVNLIDKSLISKGNQLLETE